MLFLRAHLAEGALMAVRPKDRIVAKSGRPSRREDKDTLHSALESFVCAIRPGQRQDADESRPPRRRGGARPEFALDAGHGGAKVFCPAPPIWPSKCPARRQARRRRAPNRRRAQRALKPVRRLAPSKAHCRERSIPSPPAPRDPSRLRRPPRRRRAEAVRQTPAACRNCEWR